MPDSQASKGNSSSAIALGPTPSCCAYETVPRVLSGQLLLAADKRHGKGACFGGAWGLVLQIFSDSFEVTQAVTFLQEMHSLDQLTVAQQLADSQPVSCDCAWDRYL